MPTLVSSAGDLADLITEALPLMDSSGALFALAPESQPVYPSLRPDNLWGYNGGLQFLRLDAMRYSSEYNAFLRRYQPAQDWWGGES
jgi:hypothetical protein